MVMKNISIFFLMLLCSCTSVATYTNPVIPGDMPDPSLIRFEGRYYAAGTSSEWAPYYPVYSSDDLVNWNHEGYVFDEKPSWTVSSFWAPELYCMNDRVYCYYTARRASDGVSYIGVASSDRPDGDYQDHGLIVEHGSEAIDAFVFDDDGQLYISWKAYGRDSRPIEIVAARLSQDGLSLESEPFSLLVDEEGIGMEGQCHLKIGDYYYIIYAARGCCGPGSDYEVRVARSENYLGPYEYCPSNPILKGGDGDFFSCGHGTVVYGDDGRMFYMCHAYKKGAEFYMGRQPVLHELVLDDEGWLSFASGRIAASEHKVPFKGVKQKLMAGFHDDFDASEQSPEWTWNYPYADVSAVCNGSKLYLSGNPFNGNRYGVAYCVKARIPQYSVETLLLDSGGNVSGLTFYGDMENLMIWGLADGKLRLVEVVGGNENVIFQSENPGGQLYLKADVHDGCKAVFLYSTDGENWKNALQNSIDMSELVRWDRVFRPGLVTTAANGDAAVFGYFSIQPTSTI